MPCNNVYTRVHVKLTNVNIYIYIYKQVYDNPGCNKDKTIYYNPDCNKDITKFIILTKIIHADLLNSKCQTKICQVKTLCEVKILQVIFFLYRQYINKNIFHLIFSKIST